MGIQASGLLLLGGDLIGLTGSADFTDYGMRIRHNILYYVNVTVLGCFAVFFAITSRRRWEGLGAAAAYYTLGAFEFLSGEYVPDPFLPIARTAWLLGGAFIVAFTLWRNARRTSSREAEGIKEA